MLTKTLVLYIHYVKVGIEVFCKDVQFLQISLLHHQQTHVTFITQREPSYKMIKPQYSYADMLRVSNTDNIN